MLILENVSIHAGEKTIIKKTNITFAPGINYITGYSGSGKSTLMDAICGISKHDIHGDIKYNGKRIQCDVVSHVKTNSNMYEFFTFNQMVRFYTSFHSFDQDYLKKLLLIIHDIDKYKQLSTYSSGQKKRCKLIIDLIVKKNIICLDEPYANLSERDQDMVTKIIEDTVTMNKNCIIIICTHHEKLIKPGSLVINIDNTKVEITEKVEEQKNTIDFSNISNNKHFFPWYTRLYNMMYLEYYYVKSRPISTNVCSQWIILFILFLTELCIPLSDDFTLQFKMIMALSYTIIISCNHEYKEREEVLLRIIQNDVKLKKILYVDFIRYILLHNFIQSIYFSISFCIGSVLILKPDNWPIETFFMLLFVIFMYRCITYNISMLYGLEVRNAFIYVISLNANLNNGLFISYDECNTLVKLLYHTPTSMVISTMYDEMVIDMNPIPFTIYENILISIYTIGIYIGLAYILFKKLKYIQNYIIKDNNIELEELLP